MLSNKEANEVFEKFYRHNNDLEYIKKSNDIYILPIEISKYCQANNIEIMPISNNNSPSAEFYFSLDTFEKDEFVVDYTSKLTVSKISNCFQFTNEFEVVNIDPNKIEPTLDGFSENDYNVSQFELRKVIEQVMINEKMNRLSIVEGDEKIEGIHYSTEVTIFGPYVTASDLLFKDILEKVPE